MSNITDQVIEALSVNQSEEKVVDLFYNLASCLTMIAGEFKAQMPASLSAPIESHVSQLTNNIYQTVNVITHKTAIQLFTGQGPVGRKFFDYITLHKAINAYQKLPENYAYNFDSDYEERFIYPVLIDPKEELAEINNLFNLIQTLQKNKLIQKALEDEDNYYLGSLYSLDGKTGFINLNKSPYGYKNPAFYLMVPAEHPKEAPFFCVVSLSENFYQRDLFYYHPAEQLWAEGGDNNRVVIEGTVNRLKKALQEFLVQYGFQVEHFPSSKFNELKSPIEELIDAYLKVDRKGLICEHYTVVIRKEDDVKSFELQDSFTKNSIQFSFHKENPEPIITLFTGKPKNAIVASFGNIEMQMMYKHLNDALRHSDPSTLVVE